MHDDGEGAELLDRLVEGDPPAVDLEPLLGKQPLDVEVSDRPEEPTLLARSRLHAELHPLEALGHRVGALALALGLGADDALLVLEDAQVLPARLDREPAREEEVPG